MLDQELCAFKMQGPKWLISKDGFQIAQAQEVEDCYHGFQN